MAKIIKANGETIEVEPRNGNDFKLEELKDIVNGYIEIVWLPMNKILVVNEDGKALDLPVNEAATKIYHDAFGFNDIIVGDVLLCNDSQVE